MRDFGIRMEGCEDAIEAIVKEACGKFDPFRYLEIGVGGGGTLKAVTEICRENHKGVWWTLGLDLPEGWSLNMDGVRARMPDIRLSVLEDPIKMVEHRLPNLWLMPSDYFLLKWDMHDNDPFHVVLIDGCHGKACVMADFLGVEPLVDKGGFVIFHDAGIDEQGVDMQPHCGEPINVVKALYELGLLKGDDGEVRREGWEYHRFIEGEKSRGGHSCVVVQKV